MKSRLSIWVCLCVIAGGCYERGDVCVGPDCSIAEGGIPEVELDPDSGAPAADTDGDGIDNAIDTDDDDDGIQDDLDVDVDGDGLLEEAPSADTIAASWAVAYSSCDLLKSYCGCSGGLQGSGMSDIAGCRPLQFPGLLVELAQAAALAGANVDRLAWPDERLPSMDEYQIDVCHVPEKGQVTRALALEEIVLPYVHGTTRVGDPCFTRWDCEVDARCDDLVPESGAPGVCGVRPVLGGPCGAGDPYCPVGTTCTILEEGSVCERPREDDDFCRVFELGGRTTDNCGLDAWCDATRDAPICRNALRPRDPCEEARQCPSFACSAEEGCGDYPDYDEDFPERQREAQSWCPAMFPTAIPYPDSESS